MESFKEVNQLKTIIDVFIIEGILKDFPYLLATLKKYKTLLTVKNYEEKAEEYVKQYEKDHDSGFLYKKTVYVKY